MALTVGNALKALIEGAAIGVSVYRDKAPQGTARPYVTVSEGLDSTPHPAFNQFDDPEGHTTEMAQVDLWQDYRDANQAVVEDYSLADDLAIVLRGTRLTNLPFSVSGVRLVSGPERLLETVRLRDGTEVIKHVHHAFTVEIDRTAQRS